MLDRGAAKASVSALHNIRGFVGNVLSLTLVQAISYLVPLVTLPYLTRVLGIDAWGELVFYQALSVVFALWVNWGFPIFATNLAAADRDDKIRLSFYLANVTLAQSILLVISAIVTVASVVVWLSDARGRDFLLAVWLVTSSLVVFPAWILQGLELFRFLAVTRILSRLLPVPLVFLFVHGPADASLVIYFNAGAGLLVGLFSLWWLRRRYEISVLAPRLSSAAQLLRQSALLFCSSAATSAYTSLVPVVLGMLTSPYQLALFALADRVRLIITNIFMPISQSLFPRMSFLMKRDQNVGLRFLRVVGSLTVAATTIVSIIVFSYAAQIATWLGGEEFVDGAGALRLLAFVPAIVAVSNIIGIQYLVPLGRQKIVNTVLIGVALASLLAMYPILVGLGATGAALLILTSESLIAVILAVVVLRKHSIGALRDDS